MGTMLDIVSNLIDFLDPLATRIGEDVLFIIALAVEALLVIFFLVKSAYSYEASLNRSLDKINYWLFERKVLTEENVREFNTIMKTKAPKRLCYYWQQYILFREDAPSTYMSTENLVEKPLKTSSYNSNIKNLNVISAVWAIFVGLLFILVGQTGAGETLSTSSLGGAIAVVGMVYFINLVFTIYLRARKNALLNSIFQNVSLFGRFMDNACIDLPTYIDYQILFTPEEIEKGQPVLREFLDYKARREKEEFNKAKEQQIEYETYDFSSTGVSGSVVLDRAMKESELYLNKKEKIYVKIAQLESELDTRKKNFDNVQKDYQNKLQASRENIDRLLQQQEETTNRIESNYLRKQQTQEIAKQEQLEQEFEQQRARYLLEKQELEEEIKKNNEELENNKKNVETVMLGEYQNFFDNFCKSAEKVVTAVMANKLEKLKAQNDEQQQRITELEIKIKNTHQGVYDGAQESAEEGKYDENGNFVYANGTYYDKDGLFHNTDGNVYDADGNFVRKDEVKQEEKVEKEEKEEEKKVDLNDLNAFDFMTDVSEKDDVYDVAENVIKKVAPEMEVVNSSKEEEKKEEKKDEANLETFSLDEVKETPEVKEEQEEKPKKKAGRPRKIVTETLKPKGQRGRPRKTPQPVETKQEEKPKKKPGRPKKIATEEPKPKKAVGRPRKTEVVENKPKGKRGRPKKNIDQIEEINKKISEERNKLSEMRDNLNKEFELAIKNLDEAKVAQDDERREELTKEIEKLQEEAKSVNDGDSEKRIAEINEKLESLIEEVKKLNS